MSLTNRARRRAIVPVLLAAALVASACTGSERRVVGPTLMEMARALGSDVVERLVRGYVPGRSGDVALIPEPWNVLGQWREGREGVNDPRNTHATPWDYHQRVPITLWGPGYIRERTVVDRPTSITDIAPTLAELMHFEHETPDGSVLHEALLPARQRRQPPRAIVVVVVDGGGWNVLDEWPRSYPEQHRIMVEGTTYINATNGSAPSVTAPTHGNIGAGVYPRDHGIAENAARLPNGDIGDIALERADLRLMTAETLGDRWDRATGNEAWVGMIGYESWHLAMMGHGAGIPGGDRDMAVLWDTETIDFWTNTDHYSLPDYLPGREALDQAVIELDGTDGARDGYWGGHTLDPEAYHFPANPAFADYHGEATLAIAENEPIGADDVTDLFFVELKTGDIAGHVWGMQGAPFRTVWETQDRVFGELKDVLDRRIGEGEYVLAVTADHGQTPLAENVGGLRIDRFRLGDQADAEFGVVATVQPSDLYVNLEEFEDSDVTLEEIARWVGAYRYRDGLPSGFDPEEMSEELLNTRVFAGALPGPFLESLTPEEIAALGPGEYPEGDLTSVPDIASFP